MTLRIWVGLGSNFDYGLGTGNGPVLQPHVG